MTPRTTLDATSLPPAEAIAFLRQKANVTSQHWTDVWQEAHSRSFMVAGAATQALVGDFREAVARAIEQGTTLADFRRDFDRIVAEHGWVHNGTPAWRSQIILETNLSTAYSAGRYARATDPDVLRVFPYWQYQHTSSAHPRPEHLAWVGTTLPADDPWWSTHYPPNGWRCKCGVRPVSEAGLGRMGKSGPDRSPPVDLRPWRNPRTGEIVQVPHGIDPGFGYNPGQAWQQGTPPPDGGGPLAPPTGPLPRTPRLPPAEAVPPPAPSPTAEPPVPPLPIRTPSMPAPTNPSDLLPALRDASAAVRIGEMGADLQAALGDPAGEVLLSPETMAKQLARHPDLLAAEYAALPRLLAEPDLVLRLDARKVRLLGVTDAGQVLCAVVKTTGAGHERFIVSLYRIRAADLRRYLRKEAVVLGTAAALGLKGIGAPEGPPTNPP